MEVRSVLLAFKVTLYERFGVRRRDPRLVALLARRAPIVAKVESSHLETVRSRDRVRLALEHAGVKVAVAARPARVPDGRYDLVVVVGGDGTVLDIARNVRGTPVLAVNSSPSSSIGHFCASTADEFADVLERIRAGSLQPRSLSRIRVSIDGRDHPQPALNDVLFAAPMPAATSRYVLEVGGAQEEQKSSGVWVSTAAGSTGSVRSAGGVVMDPSDDRLQYLVREPFYRFGEGLTYRLVHGLVDGEGMALTSRMIEGGVYLDGRRTSIAVRYAGRVGLTPDGPRLNVFLPRWKH